MYLVGIMRVVNTIDLFELPEAILEIKMPLCFQLLHISYFCKHLRGSTRALTFAVSISWEPNLRCDFGHVW